MTQITEIDPVTANQWANDGEAILIDVREQSELTQASVNGAIHVPMSSFDQSLIPVDSGKKIVIFCAHGQRSLQVSQYLIANGILAEAHNLTGGLAAWLEAGLPVESNL
jgi:rhodanese-related sulfurtransferase